MQKVRDYLAVPGKWVQGRSGTYETGMCLIGAICYFEAEGEKIPAQELFDALERRGFFSITAFNDSWHTEHKDVLALLDEVIAAEPTVAAPENTVPFSSGTYR